MTLAIAHSRRTMLAGMALLLASGCNAIPNVAHKPNIHNPFPQLHRIAVVPFFNQSKEPTVDGDAIAIAYATELQQIPGFEVMPVGVAKQVWLASGIDPRGGSDFQQLARVLGVDAVVVGSITEYYPYYPPRLGLTVDWYAANPSFHPIPVGYGLPWGTADEEYIPDRLKMEAEFELAREQLATQTPSLPEATASKPATIRAASHRKVSNQLRDNQPELLPPDEEANSSSDTREPADSLPDNWPDPSGFVPPAPQASPPTPRPQSKPVMTHTRLYNGKNSDFTEKLEKYFEQQDDARFGGWQAYLQRPEDFIRFCCHLHTTETLAARGGAGRTQVMVRWPASR